MATIKYITCNLLYKTDKHCILCNQEVLCGVSRPDDVFVLEGQVTLELHEMLSYILGKEYIITELDVVCTQCTRSAMSTYKFLKMCKDNLKSLYYMLQGFEKGLNSIKTTNNNAVFLTVSTISFDSEPAYTEKKISSSSISSDYNNRLGSFKSQSSKNINKNKKHEPSYSLIKENGVSKYKCKACQKIYLNHGSFRTHLYKFHRNQTNLLRNDYMKSDICTIVKVEGSQIKEEVTEIAEEVTQIAEEVTHIEDEVTQIDEGVTQIEEEVTQIEKEVTQIARYNFSCKTFSNGQNKRRLYSPGSRNITPHNVREGINKSICNVKKEHGKEIYECQSCDQLFISYKFLVKHYIEAHGSTIDEQVTVNEDKLSLEIDDICTVINESGSARYQCKSCLSTFDEKTMLFNHYHQVHGPGIVNGSQSDGGDTMVDGIKYTIVIRNGCTLYQCDICSKYLYCPSLHSRCHRKYGTKSEKKEMCTVCSICGKRYTSIYSLQKHEYTHITEKHQCLKCKKMYKTEDYLKLHVCYPGQRYGNPPKKFQCDICNQKFAYKKTIEVHMRYKHLAPGFMCPICSKTFPRKYRLSEHMVVHTKAKNFPCEVCHNKFVCKSSLKKHMRLHTGERPFPCQHCDQAFVSSSTRADHVLRKHTVNPPARPCDMCSEVFYTRQAIAKHKQKHFKTLPAALTHKMKDA